MYYTYMIRCNDNSIYTGMTNNIDERFNKHLKGNGAKYTKSHIPDKFKVKSDYKEICKKCPNHVSTWGDLNYD